MSEELVSVTLGDEYDDALRNALRVVLVREGAVETNNSWGVGGSQEISTLEVKFGDYLLTIETETYIGLTISGPKLIVEGIAEQVRRELG